MNDKLIMFRGHRVSADCRSWAATAIGQTTLRSARGVQPPTSAKQRWWRIDRKLANMLLKLSVGRGRSPQLNGKALDGQ